MRVIFGSDFRYLRRSRRSRLNSPIDSTPSDSAPPETDPMPQRLWDFPPPPETGGVAGGVTGGVTGPPAKVIESRVVVMFPAESVTVMVISFVPEARGIDAVQVVVPVAVPLWPVSEFDQVTCETPPPSAAVPDTVRGEDAAGPDEGDVMVIVGGVVSAGPPP